MQVEGVLVRQERSAVFRYLTVLLEFRRDHKYRITLDGAGRTGSRTSTPTEAPRGLRRVAGGRYGTPGTGNACCNR